MRLRRLRTALAVVVLTGCSAVSTANVSRGPSPAGPPPPPTTVAVADTVAPSPPPAPAVDAPAQGAPAVTPAVFVVGDSLTVGTQPWLDAAVRARGWTLTGVDARVGRTVTEGLRILQRRARSLPATVIVALGTNNLGASAQDVDAWMGAARRIVGADRRLVWVNLSLADDGSGRAVRYHEINTALAASARAWRVDVLDWDRWTHRNRITPKADGIHYEDGVYRLRALLYAAALARPTAP